MSSVEHDDLVQLTAEIVSAYVSDNKIASGELSKLIQEVHEALTKIGPAAPVPETALATTRLRDTLLTNSVDELLHAVDRGDIDPDKLWVEVLESLERSAGLVHDIARIEHDVTARIDDFLPRLKARQHGIDTMIEGWRTELGLPKERPVAHEQRIERNV